MLQGDKQIKEEENKEMLQPITCLEIRTVGYQPMTDTGREKGGKPKLEGGKWREKSHIMIPIFES